MKLFRFSTAIFLTLLLSWASPAIHAATITVDTTDDELNSDGDCSLREAIRAANTDSVVDNCTEGLGLDTVMVPAGTFTLTGGELTVSDNLTLAGAGADSTIIEADTVAGLATFRVLSIQNFLVVGISDLTIRHGNLLGGLNGGGILNQGSLTVTASTIAHNSGFNGGGIFNSGGTLTVNSSLFKGNVASSGGGIFNSAGGTLTLTESTLTHNLAVFATLGGGGIYNTDSTLDLNRCTISGNAARRGGGIYSDGGSVTSTNSTVSSNVGVFEGGGIYNQGSATVTMTNSTVTGNISGTGGGVFNISPGTVVLENTIIADHPAGSDCSGPGFTSLGNNLDSNNSCNLTDPGDLTGVAPLLGSLQDNGGPTETHALLSGSPAINAGNDLSAPPTDQRVYHALRDSQATSAHSRPTRAVPWNSIFSTKGTTSK